ncbi:DNA recombination protein RmuC, partial [Escherichia coli]|uniref:DNA recombination protein RmuC n=1 Tax=Escherichia coli TaxID=562 RepID=UPI0029292757
KAVRTHVDALAKKSYWEAFSSTPEFVVMFLPSDPFLDTVLQEDPSILDYAFSQNVILSTPTTLIALLKTVALTWQHDTITQEAKAIQKLGYELYQRLGTVIQHFTTLGAQLEKAVDSYNSALGSVESRLVVTARKLENYGISPASVVISPEEIDSSPRAVSNKWVSSR